MSEAIREKKIAKILSAANVAFSARFVGATVRDSWECDAWRVTLKGARSQYESDYFTGLGHRAKPGAVDALRMRNKYGKSAERTQEWRDACKPVPPDAADVLWSLLMDSSAENIGFADWCAEYGYSDDSIKALKTYHACQETARNLRLVFTHAQIAELSEALQDF